MKDITNIALLKYIAYKYIIYLTNAPSRKQLIDFIVYGNFRL